MRSARPSQRVRHSDARCSGRRRQRRASASTSQSISLADTSSEPADRVAAAAAGRPLADCWDVRRAVSAMPRAGRICNLVDSAAACAVCGLVWCGVRVSGGACRRRSVITRRRSVRPSVSLRPGRAAGAAARQAAAMLHQQRQQLQQRRRRRQIKRRQIMY